MIEFIQADRSACIDYIWGHPRIVKLKQYVERHANPQREQLTHVVCELRDAAQIADRMPADVTMEERTWRPMFAGAVNETVGPWLGRAVDMIERTKPLDALHILLLHYRCVKFPSMQPADEIATQVEKTRLYAAERIVEIVRKHPMLRSDSVRPILEFLMGEYGEIDRPWHDPVLDLIRQKGLGHAANKFEKQWNRAQLRRSARPLSQA